MEEDEPSVVLPHDGVDSLKPEGHSNTCCNMDGPRGITLSEVNQSQKDKHAIHLYEVLRDTSTSCKVFAETESRIVGARGWRGGDGELVFHRMEFHLGEDETVLRWMEGCTKMWNVFETTEPDTSKNG